MRTTIDLPEPLLRQVKARAALDGTTLKRLIRSFVEQGLRRLEEGLGADTEPKKRSEIPTISRPTGASPPALSNAELCDLLEQEDIARELRTRRSS